ncbi:MAG: NAD(P)H-dependent glycerol-3-phosphate dehydrogenase [Betaproteobacteria bacterium]
MRIAILGAGAWGTALAVALASRHEILLWSRTPEDRAALRDRRRSPRLPGIAIPEPVFVAETADALAEVDLFIAATSTAGLAPTLRAFAPAIAESSLLWACKGFEATTGRLPHAVVADALPGLSRAGGFSGPSFALEVARGLPAALTVTSADMAFAKSTAAALNGQRLRIYSSADVIGAELGGAVKNVMAIATGICDGLKLGANARAALITRGLAEMARLGVRMGGQAETFMGLTGLGDLVLTATGDLSRNRSVGLGIAAGERLDEVLARLGHVAEGVSSARCVRDLARRHGLEMPITEMVCAVLFEGLAPATAAEQLLARDPRAE